MNELSLKMYPTNIVVYQEGLKIYNISTDGIIIENIEDAKEYAKIDIEEIDELFFATNEELEKIYDELVTYYNNLNN
jgi:hypothetical protein